VALDLELLSQRRRYVDPVAGIAEEFIQPEFGGSPTVGIVSRPVNGHSSVGFVLCHSFGIEQIHLSRFDSVMARALARAGVTVLRFHAPGYGDNHVTVDQTRLSLQLASATEAVRWLAQQDGITRVGSMGARVGGMVAALVADREQLPLLAVWEPVVSGAQYMRDFLRSQQVHKMVLEATGERNGQAAGDQPSGDRAGNGSPRADLEVRRQLDAGGWAEIKGFPLSAATYREFTSVDLANDLEHFSGSALVMGLGRSSRMGGGQAKLVERLQSLGAHCSAEVLQDRAAGQFGQHHHANGPGAKVDIQFALTRSVAEATVAWVHRQAEAERGKHNPARVGPDERPGR
jgi:hypothetical protein